MSCALISLHQRGDNFCEAPAAISLRRGLWGEGMGQRWEGDGQSIMLMSLPASRGEFSIPGWWRGSDLFQWLLAREQPPMRAQLERQIPGDLLQQK